MEKWLTPPLVLSLIALGIGVINSYYTRRRDQQGDWKKELEELQKEIDELSKQRDEDREAQINMTGDLRLLNKQMDVFWKTVEQQMAKKYRDKDDA